MRQTWLGVTVRPRAWRLFENHAAVERTGSVGSATTVRERATEQRAERAPRLVVIRRESSRC